MNKYRKIILVALIAVDSVAFAATENSDPSRISANFEGAGAPGIFTYESTSNGLDVNYYSPTRKDTLHYHVKNFDVCSSMTVYLIRQSNQLAIDGSCASQGGQIFRYIYEWKKNYGNWCLVREVTGEKPDITADTVTPVEHVARVSGCSEIGASGPYSYESDAVVATAIKDELQRFTDVSHKSSDLKAFLASMPNYAISELTSYVNFSTVESINNLAFYLTENGRAYEAIPVLIAVVSKFPNRVVAKLNLADAYWSNGFKAQAVKQYEKYLEQMKQTGKTSLVPKRVLERLDH